MAITATEQQQIFEYMVGIYGAAPGGYMNYLADYTDANSAQAMATALATGGIATGGALAAEYGSGRTDAQFAASFCTNLLGNTVSAANMTALQSQIVTLCATYSRPQIMVALVGAIANMSTTDANWGAAATAFDVSVAAAQASTYTGTDLGTLQSIVAGTYEGYVGDTFTLTAAADTVDGTAGDDLIVATQATLSAADAIHGNAGADELKLSSTAVTNYAAFEMDGVETVTVTADAGTAQTLDMSGSDDVDTFETLNSTGDVRWNYATQLADIDATNITNDADIALYFQTTVVAGTTDEVAVNLNSNANANVGTIAIGQIDGVAVATEDGIETVTVDVQGNAHTVGTLDSDIETLNVTGDQNLTITADLNTTVDTVDAADFSGDLNIGLVGNVGTVVANNLTVDAGSGDDTIDMTGIARDMDVTMGAGDDTLTLTTATGDATVDMGDGDDTLSLGDGDDDVVLGAGDDAMDMDATQLTVADTIDGGAGNDTLTLNDDDFITASEAQNVDDVETIVMTTAGTTLEVHNNMVESITGDAGALTVDMGVGGNTVDITNVDFTNTNLLTVTGTTGADTIVVDDAVMNAAATLTFGDDAGDTLRVIDGATITADDFANTTGLVTIELVADSSEAQTWNIDGLEAAIGDGTSDVLTINVDRDVQTGSELYIDTTALGASLITVNTNSNTTVYVDGVAVAAGAAAVSGVTVQSSLEFTENADNLVGAGTFSANSLDQMDAADNVSATGIADLLRLDFSVNNVAVDLDDLLNNFAENAVTQLEAVTFNTNSNISFKNITTSNTLDSVTTFNFGNGNNTVVDFSGGAFATATFGTGNDAVTGSTTAGTYNMGNGTNAYTAAASVAEVINAGTGTDTVTFAAVGQWAVGDTLALSTGTDTVVVTMAGALDVSAYVNVTGVDQITAIASGGVRTLTLDDTMVDQADNTNNLIINANDDDGAAGEGLVVNAGGVTSSNSVTINIIDNLTAAAAGTADFIGGAGDDTFNVTANGTVDDTEIRGNAGADTINLGVDTVAGTDEQTIEFATENDGGAQGANSGYDTINGFITTVDHIQFAAAEGLELGIDDIVANNTIAWVSDAAANFTATDEAQFLSHLNNGVTDAQLVESGFATILTKINVGLTSAAGDEGLIVIQGATDTGIYWYTEDGATANNVSVSELKLLGIVNGQQLATGDFQIA